MTLLQQQALKKYLTISMGNGSDARIMKLYAIHELTHKAHLTPNDIAQLSHFLNASRSELEHTAYVANSVINTQCWNYESYTVKKR